MPARPGAPAETAVRSRAEAPQAGQSPAVIYVHGLWMMGAECYLLGRHLWREWRLPLTVFRYRSVRQSAAEAAAQLHALIERLQAPQVHLIGHSLGGSIVLECLERHALRRPGRVLLMGAPVLGSRSAQHLARWSWGRRVMGRAVADELLAPPARRWDSSREVGIIAGTRPLGFGQLLLRFDEPNDGTVALSETQLPGATASIQLPLTHMGLLFSAKAAREAGSFLMHGRFGL
jgi:pimeloyl-ACP methyl ester carboxylesterase